MYICIYLSQTELIAVNTATKQPAHCEIAESME